MKTIKQGLKHSAVEFPPLKECTSNRPKKKKHQEPLSDLDHNTFSANALFLFHAPRRRKVQPIRMSPPRFGASLAKRGSRMKKILPPYEVASPISFARQAPSEILSFPTQNSKHFLPARLLHAFLARRGFGKIAEGCFPARGSGKATGPDEKAFGISEVPLLQPFSRGAARPPRVKIPPRPQARPIAVHLGAPRRPRGITAMVAVSK